jgi:hypothetical protein
MHDFILRTVSDSIEFVDHDGNKTKVTATRSRTSASHAAITMDIDGKRVLELTSDLEDYPSAARNIARLLLSMADEPCALPNVRAKAGTTAPLKLDTETRPAAVGPRP